MTFSVDSDNYYSRLSKACCAQPTVTLDKLRQEVLLDMLDEDDGVLDIEAEFDSLLPPGIGTATTPVILLEEPMFAVASLPELDDIFAQVIQGENSHNFATLERDLNQMRKRAYIKHLMLVGPPSVGKTMTAQIAARALERPFLPLSGQSLGSDLFSVINGVFTELHRGSHLTEIYKHPDNRLPVRRLAPSTIFIDEAHELSMRIQNLLLVAMERPYIALDGTGSGTYYDFRDVQIILGTTDPAMKSGSGGLLGALRSRCIPFFFMPYGVETVGKIVRKSYPHISKEDSELLARAAKLVPRMALTHAERVGDDHVPTFLERHLGADSLGLDPKDRLILKVLEESIRQESTRKLAEARMIVEMHANQERILPGQLAKARSILETVEFKPMGLVNLSDKVHEQPEELRARVNYLETLGLVSRRPNGVVRVK